MYSRSNIDPVPMPPPPPTHRPRKINGQQRDDIRRKLTEGADPKDLALEYGITAAYIRAWFR